MPQRAKSLAKIIFFNLFFVVLFALALFWSLITAYGYRIDPVNRQVVKSGLLNLQNVTQGVSVRIDNSADRQKTPCTINNLSIAPHLLVLEHKDYQTWRKNIRVARDLVTDIGEVRLIPKITEDLNKLYARADLFAVAHDGRVAIYDKFNAQISIYNPNGKQIALTQAPRNDLEDIFWRNEKLYVRQTNGHIWEIRSDFVWQSSSLVDLILKQDTVSPDFVNKLEVVKNEIWYTNLKTEKNTLFSRFSSVVDWADWYSDTQLIYATANQVKICDLDQINCYYIADYDTGTEFYLENNALYFQSAGIVQSITFPSSNNVFLGIF